VLHLLVEMVGVILRPYVRTFIHQMATHTNHIVVQTTSTNRSN